MTDRGLNTGPDIILASASKSRAVLLTSAGIPFTAQSADLDESSVKNALKEDGASALDVADRLAEMKAVKISSESQNALVIGADQILDCDGTWFDKPESMSEARSHLSRLQGHTHYLATAVVVALGGTRLWHHHDVPALTMRKLSDVFLDQYLANAGEAILSSVGAYHLEGLGAQLFSSIDGNFFSILGLPLLPVLAFLREHEAVLS